MINNYFDYIFCLDQRETESKLTYLLKKRDRPKIIM